MAWRTTDRVERREAVDLSDMCECNERVEFFRPGPDLTVNDEREAKSLRTSTFRFLYGEKCTDLDSLEVAGRRESGRWGYMKP